MTKPTGKNIYNFDTVESNLDINEIISSVSETTDFEKKVRYNVTKLNGGYKNHKLIPLVFNLETKQIGGNDNIEDSISTEQLENKLKKIFTKLENNQSGGNCDQDQEHQNTKRDDGENVPLILANEFTNTL